MRAYIYGLAGWLLWYKFGVPIVLVPLILLGFYAATGGYRFLYIFVKTIRRDSIGALRYAQIMMKTGRFQKNNMTVPVIFEEHVKKHPNKICYISEERKWTFKQISEMSNKVARIFEDAGFKPGDTVALMLENRPEYVALWLGLAKAGIVTALINYNLRDKSLVHSINIVDSKAIIFGMDFANAVQDVCGQIDSSIKLYAFDCGTAGQKLHDGMINLDKKLDEASPGPLSGPQRSNYSDKLLYIYTSGTTGLPKAAVIKNSRFVFATVAGFLGCGIRMSDTIYVYLPLYHMSGGVMGVGMTLVIGCSSAIRKKFSVTHFWTDCIRYGCTATQYLGEVCRYLLAAPPRPEDRSHSVRLFYGAGLRPQIWKEFVERFNIPSIGEYYGASEGNANIMNFDGKVGAVGFISLIMPSIYPLALIKVDEETGEPIRGPDGLCIRCGAGEPGMFIGMIEANHPIRDFHGYADQNATNKKIARDVFKRGDAAFLSGDVLVMDELGYLFFLDRTGDTFRWRGENVSTTEVEAVISNAAELRDCCVYGVEIPGCEGRAGMAAIMDPDKTLDLSALASKLAKVLPSYARPLFIRLVGTIDMTGTYKMRKTDYQKEAFDPAKMKKDALYFWDAASQAYVLMTDSLHQKLTSGQMRL